MTEKTIADLGEQALLDWLAGFYPWKGEGLILGPGDDCAVLEIPPDHQLLVTTDSLVEGVHFKRDWLSMRELGWRALVQNLSDIAAMAGEATGAVVALISPPDLLWRDFQDLAGGLKEAGEEYHCPIVGGNLSRGSELSVVITLLGRVERGKAITRQGAKVGDFLWVTGTLGGARAGWKALEKGIEHPVVKFYRRPQARIKEALFLKELGRIHSLMDLSDGLKTDLSRILENRGARVNLEKIPIDDSLVDFCRIEGIDPVETAILGGEDFELLFASGDPVFCKDKKFFEEKFKIPLTCIGEVTVAPEILWLKGEKEWLFKDGAFEHF